MRSIPETWRSCCAGCHRPWAWAPRPQRATSCALSSRACRVEEDGGGLPLQGCSAGASALALRRPPGPRTHAPPPSPHSSITACSPKQAGHPAGRPRPGALPPHRVRDGPALRGAGRAPAGWVALALALAGAGCARQRSRCRRPLSPLPINVCTPQHIRSLVQSRRRDEAAAGPPGAPLPGALHALAAGRDGGAHELPGGKGEGRLQRERALLAAWAWSGLPRGSRGAHHLHAHGPCKQAPPAPPRMRSLPCPPVRTLPALCPSLSPRAGGHHRDAHPAALARHGRSPQGRARGGPARGAAPAPRAIRYS